MTQERFDAIKAMDADQFDAVKEMPAKSEKKYSALNKLLDGDEMSWDKIKNADEMFNDKKIDRATIEGLMKPDNNMTEESFTKAKEALEKGKCRFSINKFG